MREVNAEMTACCHNCAIQQSGHLKAKHSANESDTAVAFELVKTVMQRKTYRLYDKVDWLVCLDILLINLVRYPI